MKAIQFESYGDSSVLRVNADVPKPVLKENQVLVEVFAASVNPFDGKVRTGLLKDKVPLQFPVTIGGDFAGKVIEVNGESPVQVGDEVYGQATVLSGGSGSFAEFVASNSATVAKKPTRATFDQASALPLVGASAIQAVEEHMELKAGQKILIHGGAGGIGSTAIQLAKAIGAHVATTVSTDDMDFVKTLGADEVVDYKAQQFETMFKDFDAVYDTVGGDITGKSFVVLKKGGILVSMVGQPDEALATKYGVKAVGQGTKTTTAHLTRLSELVDSGKIIIQIAKVFPFDQAAEAFAYQEKGHPRGKVVVHMK